MTDFGADESFAEAVEKINEHYGIEVPASALGIVTQRHAQAMLDRELDAQLGPSGVSQLIAEMDGSMVPIVGFPEAEAVDSTTDKRKQRKTEWKQARLVMVRKSTEVSKFYQATMGDAERAGARGSV